MHPYQSHKYLLTALIYCMNRMIFTNFYLLNNQKAAGILGAKWGIKLTLICGLVLQLFAYGLLFGWNDDWSKTQAIIYVTFAQMFAGVAKDLTKLGGKTVTKLVRLCCCCHSCCRRRT